MKEKLKILTEKIRSAKSILIIGHKNVDADSMCSALALARLIELNFNKTAVCVYDGNMPDMLDNIPMRNRMRYFAKVDLSQSVDLAFILDYGTIKNIGALLPVVSGQILE